MKRNRFCSWLVSLGLLAVLSTGIASAEDLPVQYFKDLKIPSNTQNLAEPATIAANIYMPKITDPNQRFPLIVMPNSWGQNQYQYTKPAQKLAANGFIVLSYSARGWGKSTGHVGIAADADFSDASNIITWAINHYPVNPNAIGMAGVSYGSGISLLTAARDKRIKAVAVMSGWSDLANSFFSNNTPLTLWGSILMLGTIDKAKLSTTANDYVQKIIFYGVNDSLLDWANKRSAKFLVDKYNQNQTAILLSNNVGDQLFNPDDMLAFYKQLRTPRKMILNQGVHAFAAQSGIRGEPSYLWDQVTSWFNQYLKDQPSSDNQYASDYGTTWVYEQPNLASAPHRLVNFDKINTTDWYLAPTQTSDDLSQKPVDATSFALTQGSSGFSSNDDTMAVFQALKYYANLKKFTPNKAKITSVNTDHGRLFSSQPLSSATAWQKLLGVPSADIWLRIDKVSSINLESNTVGQLVVYLYAIDDKNNARLLSYGDYTFPKDKTTLASLQHVNIKMRALAYDLKPNQRLAFAIGTRDPMFYSTLHDHWSNYRISVYPSVNGKYSSVHLPWINDTAIMQS